MIIKLKYNCKTCGGKLNLEKETKNRIRYTTLFCENWCFTSTKARKIKESGKPVYWKHRDGKHFRSLDGVNYEEMELKITPGYIKIVPKLNKLL